MATVDDSVIRQYGQKKDLNGLRDYIETVNNVEFLQMIKDKLHTTNFIHTLNYIMQSFAQTPELHEKRFNFVKCLLQELEDADLSSTHINNITSRIIIELTKFKAQDLVYMVDFCIECIQKGTVTGMSWKEFLPELLNVLSEREMVEHNDMEICGTEYKAQVVQTLCMMQWSPNIITSLASMFSDVVLTKEEHFAVVTKLTQSMEKLTPQEIPVFVYQLLKLCKNQNSRAIFLRLQNYFGTRINYTNSETSSSESMDLNLIENASDLHVQQAESTVLYHIYQSAYLGHESIKDYLSSLKNLTKCPEFILQPFQLSVLLSISTIAHYEERALELIRMCISRNLHEQNRRNDSLWVREMTHSAKKLELIFSQVIEASIEERNLVTEGLVTLSFVLLGVGSALGRDLVAEKQWHLGSFILLKLIKRKRQITPIVIQTLNNRIVTGQNVNQYIECLCIMSNNMPLLMLENLNCILELLEVLVQVPGQTAQKLLTAIIPLTKLSPTIRDQLILLLRKGLYSRVLETRQMAVTGFLKLLKNLKISNLAALSQSSSSSGSYASCHSIFTQISLNSCSQSKVSGTSNEALCLEVLRILKRCFMQQAEVRAQLYEELYQAVSTNPELGIPVLDVIWIHFSDFYNSDETILPPLKFAAVCATNDTEVTLKEPIGKLIYMVGLILSNIQEADDDNPTRKKFVEIFKSLTKRMINSELIHFELDDGTDLLDIMPESQEKLMILKEALQVYEALIGYHISFSGEKTEIWVQQIISLFQGYSRLVHFSKNIMNPKKSLTKKKKGDADKTTQQTTIISKKDAQKTTKNFKMPTTLLNFKTVCQILEILHRPRMPSISVTQANVLKSKLDLHRHMLQAAIDLVQSVKNTTFLDHQDTRRNYESCTEIAKLLYVRCIERLNEFMDFDTTSAVLAMECFYCILNYVIQQHSSNVKKFLNDVCGGDHNEISLNISSFVETYKKILSFEEEENDADSRKIMVIVLNTLTLLVSQIPADNNLLPLEILDWLNTIVNTKSSSNKHSATSLLTLLFNMCLKFKAGVQFFENVAIRVGDIVGSIHEETQKCEEIQFVNEAVALNTFQLLCNCIKSMLEDIDWMVNRVKSEYVLINYPGEEKTERRRENIKSKERGICCQLCFVISILTTLSNVTIQPGPILESLLKNLTHLFSSLNTLTKYFVQCSSKTNLIFQGARFERLVRLAGKQLSPVVYKLILFIDESQKPAEDAASQKKSKKRNVNTTVLKSRVLRETRLIPKVIYEIEQFSKSVVQLSNKTKVDLARFVGQGVTRDFRILQLREVLDKSGDNEQTMDETNISEENTGMEVDNEESTVYSEEESEASPQPSKKARK